MRYQEEKATQAAALLISLAGGRMNHMKLIKLLYLSDRTAILRWGRPITFDWYYSLDHGPILSFTLDRINTSADPNNPSYWHCHISERQDNEVSLIGPGDVPKDELSEAEEDLLKEIFKGFGSKTQWELRDYSHTLPEWRDPQGSRLPIEMRDILLAEGVPEEDIKEMQDVLQAEASADEMLE